MSTQFKETILKTTKSFRHLEMSGVEFIDLTDPKHSAFRGNLFDNLADFDGYDVVQDYLNRYPVNYLSNKVNCVKMLEKSKDKDTLLKILATSAAKLAEGLKGRQKRGVAEMSDVPKMFPVGSEVYLTNECVGGIVQSISLESSFFSGPYFKVRLKILHAGSGQFTEATYTMKLQGFLKQAPISELGISRITEERKKELSVRGQKVLKFFKPGTYASYQGVLSQPSYWNTRTFRADGRIVVDPVSFRQLEPELWGNCTTAYTTGISDPRDDSNQNKGVEVPEDQYWRFLPNLYGFSMALKQWGLLQLEGLSDVKWRDNAWDSLVLEADSKDMVHSLVKYHGKGFTDIIEGKGGGCIFLLHGKPGLGKTATAEAVAEILHKPLYSVSIGELGTTPDGLEANLRSILDVATIWNSVILMDEADIFLEARDHRDILRNALVGVFLRVLEYHNGVLFLTTNRVKDIDPAFFSRISMALNYSESEAKTKNIWRNLLVAAGLNPDWATQMENIKINGRQIKNAIHMAQTFALSKGREVEAGDIKRTIEATLRFETEMSNTKAFAALK